jgi:hypothetical protein
MDEVRVGEATAVRLGAALVDLEDLLPPERIAQVAFGDVPERVAVPHLVDGCGRLRHGVGHARAGRARVPGLSGLSGLTLVDDQGHHRLMRRRQRAGGDGGRLG